MNTKRQRKQQQQKDSREWVLRADGGCLNPWCERRGQPLTVHHILKRRFHGSELPENQITLCQSCHDKCEYGTKIKGEWVSQTDYQIRMLEALKGHKGYRWYGVLERLKRQRDRKHGIVLPREER